jgi:hypothetical protein
MSTGTINWAEASARRAGVVAAKVGRVYCALAVSDPVP